MNEQAGKVDPLVVIRQILDLPQTTEYKIAAIKRLIAQRDYSLVQQADNTLNSLIDSLTPQEALEEVPQ